MKQKKNALIVAYNSLNNSGVPNVIYNTVLSLYDSFNFDIVTFNDSNDYYLNKFEAKNIKVNIFVLSRTSPNNFIKRIIWKLFRKQKYWKSETDKILDSKHYDVMHSFKENDGYTFLKEALRHNVPIRIFHTNVNHKSASILSKMMFWKNKLTIKYSNKLCSVSDISGKNAFGRHHFDVIYNPINDLVYKYSDEKPTNLVLGQVGTFSTNKNQLFSMEILKCLKKDIPNAKLILVGYENEKGYLNQILESIEQNQLSDSVIFVDGKSISYVNYNAFSISLLPSHFEGASIVAVESQACGVTVFASATIPRDINLGGVKYLDLKNGPVEWSKEIIKHCYSSLRSKYQYEDFTFEIFKKHISALYQ